jgi:hypothetical protein
MTNGPLSLLIIPSSFAVKDLRHLLCVRRLARIADFDGERGRENGVWPTTQPNHNSFLFHALWPARIPVLGTFSKHPFGRSRQRTIETEEPERPSAPSLFCSVVPDPVLLVMALSYVRVNGCGVRKSPVLSRYNTLTPGIRGNVWALGNYSAGLIGETDRFNQLGRPPKGGTFSRL